MNEAHPTERQRVNRIGTRLAEEQAGFSRAIRVGNRVIVSGCTCAGPENMVAEELQGDVYGQSKAAYATISQVLKRLNSSLDRVVSVRIFVTEPHSVEEAVLAFTEVFGDIRPTASLIGIAFLAAPGLLVEIEAEAVD